MLSRSSGYINKIKTSLFISELNIFKVKIKKHKKVLIFDVFEGGNMPEGKKSIAVNVTIQSMEKTLSEKDLNEVSQKIINLVKTKTGGTIRS